MTEPARMVPIEEVERERWFTECARKDCDRAWHALALFREAVWECAPEREKAIMENYRTRLKAIPREEPTLPPGYTAEVPG